MGNNNKIFQVVIVGSGPAGLSAGAHAAVLGLNYTLLEKTDHASDTIYKFQKGKHVMATPDVLPVRSDVDFSMGSREAVLDAWNNALEEHQVNIRYNSEVKGVSGRKGNFELTLVDGDIIKTETIVLAIGLQGNLNTLPIPGAENVTHLQY